MAQFSWLMPVLIAAIIVFIVDLAGNYLDFNNRVLNALAQAVLFAVIFAAVTAYFTLGDVSITEIKTVPESP
jgi:hypothetical protein